MCFTVVMLAILITLVIAYCVFRAVKTYRTVTVINKIPGPRAYPIFGNFFDEFEHRTDIIWKITERERKYSPIYRIWHGPLPVIYVSSPEIFEKILGGNSKHLSKGYFYKFLQPWLGTGLLTSDGSKWFTHRKMLTPAFHHRILRKYLSIFHENSLILKEKLETKCESHDAFDVFPYISLCTLDIICEAAMGTKINAQSDNNTPYATAIYRVLQLTKERFLKFWLFPDSVYFATKDGKDYRERVRTLHGFARDIIEERKHLRKMRKESLIPAEDVEIGVTKKNRAFLDILLRETENPDFTSVTDDDIREEVDTFMFEGHETTAVAICWTLMLLGTHLEIQEKAYEEQKQIFGEDGARAPSMKDLNDMKLLERIIKETSRIYPSIPLVARIPDEDINYEGYTIPKGTTVILNIFSLHRNPKLYPDPAVFDPDRFLPENSCGRHPFAHVPFSAGSRNCIGQKFAIFEEKAILSMIIRNFRVVTAEDLSRVKLVNELLLKPQDGVRISITRR